MAIAVSDTSPLHYLILIGQADILPTLFTEVFVPATVRAELDHPETPKLVRDWMSREHLWLVVRPDPVAEELDLTSLDDGERVAILLAAAMQAIILLMDDRAGVRLARAKGLATTGTLGVLVLAAQRGLLDLGAAIARLSTTNFRCHQNVLDRIVAQYGGKT